MYKVIIIDDEPWTIIDIEESFPLTAMGFEVVGTYRSPAKALRAIWDNPPDLIITDIRMPAMSGIDLIQKVRERKLPCEFIIISGYSEFSYAQKAIYYNVRGYCLKPLNPDETESCLLQVKKMLDKRSIKKETMHGRSTSNRSFERLLSYIDFHFSEPLTLKDLAAAFHLNPNYCCSLFSKYTGQTFSQYLTAIRIAEAKHLLSSSDYTLEEIASLVGFRDYFYFSKVFKKKCNVSPSNYRRRSPKS